ncbi:MAG TPA: acetyl-CoA carboxylase biotin carboxyl carrier protein [Bryobacteraceae bacterium]|nr:acetyl-CoA carboxylase biotin carboxyl carrier protein [Bryobacteraceae bacterium]
MTNQEIKELLQIFEESGVAEMEVQRGENRLRLRRASTTQEVVVPVAAPPSVPAPAPAPAPAKVAAADASHTLIKSPIVGTYYDAPSPGAAPFVKIGDTVEPGQVLCIIESMKLMNEIEAEMAGTLIHKLVENGRPVEYGEALFAIRPR